MAEQRQSPRSRRVLRPWESLRFRLSVAVVGMVIEILTMLVVPVLYCSLIEFRARRTGANVT